MRGLEIVKICIAYVRPDELIPFFRLYDISFDIRFSYDLSDYVVEMGFGMSFVQLDEFCLFPWVVRMLMDTFPNIMVTGIKLRLDAVHDELSEVFGELGLRYYYLKCIELIGKSKGVCDIGILRKCNRLESFVVVGRILGGLKLNSLKSLRKLVMKNCVCNQVLNFSDWENLRIVNVENCDIVGTKNWGNWGNWGGRVRELSMMGRVCSNFDNLKVLELDGSGMHECVERIDVVCGIKLEHFVVRNFDGLVNLDGLSGLGKLKSVMICMCRRLKIIDVMGCVGLRKLIVNECYELNSIRAKKLDRIDVIGCPMIVELDFLSEYVKSVCIIACRNLDVDVGVFGKEIIEELTLGVCGTISGIGGVGEYVGLKRIGLEGMDEAFDVESLRGCMLETMIFLRTKLVNMDVAKNFGRLRYVKLTDCVLDNMLWLGECKGLKKIHFKRCEGMGRMGEVGESLEELKIEECYDLEGFEDLEDLRNLRKLKIKGCDKIKILALINSNLRLVEISECGELVDLALDCPKLVCANIGQNVKLMSVNIKCPKLAYFSMEGCDLVQNVNGLECEELRDIIVAECSNLVRIGGLSKQMRSIIIKNCTNLCGLSDSLNNLALVHALILGCPKVFLN